MASLFEWLGFKSGRSPLLVCVRADGIEAVQFEKNDTATTLTGFGKSFFTEGVAEGGAILDAERWLETLTDAMKNAVPSSLKGDSLWISVPQAIVYSFVKDFSARTSKANLNDEMLGHIRLNSPLAPEALSIDFLQSENGDTLSVGATGTPKRWLDQFKKITASLGVRDFHVIPETVAQLELGPANPGDDFALITNENKRILIGLFHNGLLYDNYEIEMPETEKMGCGRCVKEIKESAKQFEMEFKSKIIRLYFMGFTQKTVREAFEKEGFEIAFPEESPPEGLTGASFAMRGLAKKALTN